MGEFLSGSALFAILLTFGAYELGRLFSKRPVWPCSTPSWWRRC